MASTAFLDVTFTKSITMKSGCSDVSGNFRLLNGSEKIEILKNEI